ncbi:HutD/Ves family protein [Paraburkholderia terricola]|uniref:HutD/Ves family protein n=1 Tax=Paraburkholderia terricola TaxID=169427 RepID=UPI000DEF20C5|nr:HutD family protein [Paraburkholderia terricola]AXE94326.1 histidine utilization protein HutD [Paraburkholderia terricola]
MASIALMRGADLVAAPWKNGGGVTREVAVFPEGVAHDDFVWRVSVADVAQAGPFSRFAGIDRTLVLLSGAGMLLDETDGANAHAAKTHALAQPLDVARFAGEARIDARLINGATRDFNLMVRRGAAVGELEVWRGQMQPRTVSADVALLFCASGSVEITLADRQALTLEQDDTLRIDTPNALPCTIQGAGAVLAISIRYRSIRNDARR